MYTDGAAFDPASVLVDCLVCPHLRVAMPALTDLENWLTNVAAPTLSEKKSGTDISVCPRYFRKCCCFRRRAGLGSTDEWGLCAGPRRFRTRRGLSACSK